MKKIILFLLGIVSISVPFFIFAISSPTDFTVIASGSTASLLWANPVDIDFDYSMIRRSTDTYPSTILDGVLVVTGTDQSYDDVNLLDGTYYYSLFALDLSGNASNLVTGFVIIDTTAPIVVMQSPTSGARMGSSTFFSWTMSDVNMNGGYANFVIAGDPNFLFLAYQNTIFVTTDDDPVEISGFVTLPPQNFYRHVVAVDALGNQTDSGPIFFRIDNTGPSIYYQGEAVDDSVFIQSGTGDALLERGATDVSLSGGSYSVYISSGFSDFVQVSQGDVSTTSALVEIQAPTIYSRYVVVTDNRGNVSTGSQQTFYVVAPGDLTGPELTYLAPDGDIFTGAYPLHIRVEVGDDSLFNGSVHLQIASDSGFQDIIHDPSTSIHSISSGFSTGTVTFLFYPYEDGLYYRRVVASDTLGNTTTGDIRFFASDTNAPWIDYNYSGSVEDGGEIPYGESIVIGANIFDTYLSGGYAHAFIGTAWDFNETWPIHGLYHGGVSLEGTGDEVGLAFSPGQLGTGTYYRYVEANDLIGNYNQGYMQMFTIVDPESEESPVYSYGGGGGGLRQDTCPNGDISPSFYDNRCADSIAAEREGLFAQWSMGMQSHVTGNVLTLADLMRDVFVLLSVNYSGMSFEKYQYTIVSESFFWRVVAALDRFF